MTRDEKAGGVNGLYEPTSTREGTMVL